MSYFSDLIQAGDATGLHVFMTNNRSQFERNTRVSRALFDACRVGADKICEVLISFGADVNYVVDHMFELTPLSVACHNAHPACVDILLAHGVDASASNFALMETALELRDTPVGLTLDQFIDNRCRCMRSLLDAGAAIDQRNNNGLTVLMHAIWNFRLTEILVNAGASVNILNNYRSSSLHFACYRNHHDVVELLLERGADIDAANMFGMTPINGACALYNLCPAVLETLLHHGANIDIVDHHGRTALQKAMTRSPPNARSNSPTRVALLQLMATCAQTRLEESSADWIRLARNERSRPQIPIGSIGISRQRRRRNI